MTGAAAGFDRVAGLARLRDETFDVLIIGGGITGAGVALDAASRGLRTALVERDDFASGTSSKSSKLVHGGLRYLQQREYRLVYENLRERQLLLDNAPHLVHHLPFLIPLFGRNGVVNKATAKAYRSALVLYDATGGVRIGKRHQRVSKQQALKHLPTLDADLLTAAFLYHDAAADDARLTLAVVRTAVVDHGAVAVNHAGVTSLFVDDGVVHGALLEDGTVVRASVVVNAAGVWSDEVRTMAEGRDPDSIRPAKGIHITVPAQKLPCDIAAVVPVPGDRRSVFVVPWGDFTYVGTTDTDYQGDIDDPQVTPDDVAYCLRAINAWFSRQLEPADVTSTWAGLRPLVKDEARVRTADLSRRHNVAVSDQGLITITGGKLTTYRKMGQDTVDEVGRRLKRRLPRSRTARIAIRGAEGYSTLGEPGAAAALGVDAAVLAHLAGRFGGEARALVAMMAADPSLAQPLVPGLPYLRAEAVYAARYEMATTVEDVLSRRTRALLEHREASAAAAADVARLLAGELGWSDEQTEASAEAYITLARRESSAAGLGLHTA
ncbi:MAG: Glycerol-3-phosphate dehydrogenase [uncultured Acidimicrobiales bacterium]|uniref:Glycerol-3-phosphate dehydrogenase n=1 Tax=uncultured Acidimicrobiales bacterium TaxID=310071 RepID=A0A6J4HHV9_9ACTN|nr:MAG: Glycerol-3-phosphate dehydrogenase [uncultured Acidimicrobiales bacterium]